tara:strand:+ start:905 stop:1675 length:771 start_codon:yes stop_codon:yes gene_type:complete
MSKTTIPTGGITADAIDATLIADDAISEEHLDPTAITASTEKSTLVAADKFLIADSAASNAIKYVQQSNLGSGTHVQLATAENFSSTVASLSLQDVFSTTYDFYTFRCMYQQSTDGGEMRFRWLTSGSTEVSTAKYIYVSDRHEINSSSSTTQAIDHSGYNQSYAQITNNIAPSSEDPFHTLNMQFYNPYKGVDFNQAQVFYEKTYVRTDAVWRGGTGAIFFNDGNTSNTYGGFKLEPPAGTVQNFKYVLYGIKVT